MMAGVNGQTKSTTTTAKKKKKFSTKTDSKGPKGPLERSDPKAKVSKASKTKVRSKPRSRASGKPKVRTRPVTKEPPKVAAVKRRRPTTLESSDEGDSSEEDAKPKGLLRQLSSLVGIRTAQSRAKPEAGAGSASGRNGARTLDPDSDSETEVDAPMRKPETAPRATPRPTTDGKMPPPAKRRTTDKTSVAKPSVVVSPPVVHAPLIIPAPTTTTNALKQHVLRKRLYGDETRELSRLDRDELLEIIGTGEPSTLRRIWGAKQAVFPFIRNANLIPALVMCGIRMVGGHDQQLIIWGNDVFTDYQALYAHPMDPEHRNIHLFHSGVDAEGIIDRAFTKEIDIQQLQERQPVMGKLLVSLVTQLIERDIASA